MSACNADGTGTICAAQIPDLGQQISTLLLQEYRIILEILQKVVAGDLSAPGLAKPQLLNTSIDCLS